MANLHLIYQSARLWQPSSLSYFVFFFDLFLSSFWKIQIQKWSYTISLITSYQMVFFSTVQIFAHSFGFFGETMWTQSGHNFTGCLLECKRIIVQSFNQSSNSCLLCSVYLYPGTFFVYCVIFYIILLYKIIILYVIIMD